MGTSVLAVLVAAAIGVPLSLLAWDAKRAVLKTDEASAAIQVAALEMAAFKGEVAGAIGQLRMILTGVDGRNGMRSEVSDIKLRLREMGTEEHTRLATAAIWRREADDRLTALEAIKPPALRRTRRRGEQ